MKRVDFIAIDEWFDAIAARHWALLSRLGYALAVVLLFAGVAAHAYESGFAARAVARCGEACTRLSPAAILAALLTGATGVLFVFLYTRVVASIQRMLFEPFTHVRPGPPPAKAPRWAVFIHVLIGVVLFFAMATVRKDGGGLVANIDTWGGLGLIFGWWIGGRTTLTLFWPRRAAKMFTNEKARPANRALVS